MKILAVCGFGVGSSMVLKMTIDKVIKELGLTATAENTDLSTAKATPADVYFTSNELTASAQEENTIAITETEQIKLTGQREGNQFTLRYQLSQKNKQQRIWLQLYALDETKEQPLTKTNNKEVVFIEGLTKNVHLEVVKLAPLGDPMEIRLRGYELSLRKQEAALVFVEKGVETV